MDYKQHFSSRALTAKNSPITTLFKIIQANPDIVSFAPGTPDPSVLPAEKFPALTQQAIDKYGKSIIQYGMPQGFEPLRKAVLPLLKKRSITATADNVHISTGASGALNNVGMVLLDAGDTVLVESPTYNQAVSDFLAYEANVQEVACDEDGMLPDALEAQLQKQPVKFIYLLPTFQNPSGRTMPAARRKQVAELAKKYDVLIIEDDVYYDLRYTGEHQPAVYSYAPERTIYLSSLSKMFAPAVRCGYSVMPEPILEKVLMLKQYIDMFTSQFNQALAAEFLAGEYDAFIGSLCKTYSSKLATMQQALKQHMPAGYTWDKPEGGLFIWLTGPKAIDTAALLDKAIQTGVAYLPASAFFLDPAEGKNALRLSFAFPPEDRIEEGVKRLARVLQEA